MTLTFTVVGFSFVFENENFVCFAVFNNFSNNFCTFNYGLANLNISIIYNGQNFFKTTSAPTSAFSFSTCRVSPSLTRYCLPPVLIIAYIYCTSLNDRLAKYGTLTPGIFRTSLRGWGRTKSVHTGIFYLNVCYLSTPLLSKIIKLSTCREASASTFRVQASSRSQARKSLLTSHSASQGLAVIKRFSNCCDASAKYADDA